MASDNGLKLYLGGQIFRGEYQWRRGVPVSAYSFMVAIPIRT